MYTAGRKAQGDCFFSLSSQGPGFSGVCLNEFLEANEIPGEDTGKIKRIMSDSI